MPEGPSLIYVRDQLQRFEKKRLTECWGYAEAPHKTVAGQHLKKVATWGKHLLLQFDTGFIEIHLMLFGKMTINEPKQVNPSIAFRFGKDKVYFYVVKVKWQKGSYRDCFDWTTDIMDEDWDRKTIKALLAEHAHIQIGDLLLDQSVFTGVGNIIRTEALYRSSIHPSSITGKIPDKEIGRLLTATRSYAKEFLRKRKKDRLEESFRAYKQKTCERDGHKIVHKALGKSGRKIYYCTECQELYK